MQFCISYWINYFKLAFSLENIVDLDQLASLEASCSGSTLFSIEFISGFILLSKKLHLVSVQ